MRGVIRIVLSSFFVISLTNSAPLAASATRPIYNIAHMVNSQNEIDKYLGYGANAIETDVAFDDGGTPKYMYHGFPCDAGRNCWRWDWIADYIQAIRERTVPSSPKFNRNFVLLMFDMKIAKLDKSVLSQAGEKFADIALIPLYSEPTTLKVILTITDFALKDFIKGVQAHLKAKRPNILSKIGFAEEGVMEPNDLEEGFRKLDVPPGHMWLSEGTTNWFIPFKKSKMRNELVSSVQYRDQAQHGYGSKVYVWTVDRISTLVSFLETGIDGVISNNPKNVIKAMEDINRGRQASEKLRLATLGDDPFERVKKQ